MDEEYIRTASLRTDLVLLFRTAGAVLRRQGAL
jgi:lipopolysaccharide/colanic/teichoic acid biosynthesis glycosyltransferase